MPAALKLILAISRQHRSLYIMGGQFHQQVFNVRTQQDLQCHCDNDGHCMLSSLDNRDGILLLAVKLGQGSTPRSKRMPMNTFRIVLQ
jgi:hypothetical protein